MATYTSKLNLKKPAASELAKISDINGNMDLIDTFASTIDSGKANTVAFTDSNPEWTDVWNKLNGLTSYRATPVYISSSSMSILSQGARTASVAYAGIVARTGTGTFAFMVRNLVSTGFVINFFITGATSTSAGTYTESIVPRSKQISASSGSNSFTISNNSRMTIDMITSGATRMGTAQLYCSATGTISIKYDVGSNLSISTSTNTLSLTSTGGSTVLLCTIYAGDIDIVS